MARGGKREGSGRKSKADELQLIERLSPLQDLALKELEKGIKAGDFSYIKMYFEYMYGKPKETKQTTGTKEIRVIYGNRTQPTTQEPTEDL